MRFLYASSLWFSATSKCEGGQTTACFSQVPFAIDGCDDIGFGFGTIGSPDPNICWRCFLLEFTGEGVWTTKDTHRAIKNRKLIFMGINRGYADELSFDLLISEMVMGFIQMDVLEFFLVIWVLNGVDF